MKKFLIILAFLIFSVMGVQAKNIKVIALEPFSSQNPSSEFAVQTMQDESLDEGTFLPQDTLIYGIILRVEEPRRGKRNAYIEFIPSRLVYDDKTIYIKDSKLVAVITGYTPIDPLDLTLNVARKTANFVFHGAVSAAEFALGVVENQDGNRIKSGAMNVYKDSFLTYIEIGEDLNVKKGDILIFKIKRVRKKF